MVLIDKIYEKCMSGPCRGELTAQNVSFYYSSPYSIYCEKFVSHNKKDPQSPYRELLQERGQKHEKRVIENRYPGYTPLVYKKPEEGFLELLKEMASGAEVICGLPVFFLPENMEGRIDILEKQTDQSSVFGSYYYVVKEIKLSKTIRKEHILQGAFYTYMIAHIQGLLPERLFIINRDHEEEGYIYKHYEEELEDAIRVTQAILDGSEIPTPTYNGCDWPWQTYCNHQALKNRDVSLVVHVGSKKKTQLVAHGFRKIWDISSAKVDELQKIPGIGQHTAQKLILSAQALTRTELILLDKKALKFPQTTNELFLDLEGTDQPGFKDELAQVDYLIGVLSRKNNKEEYKSFFAYRPEDEGSMLREFIKFLKAQKDYVIYHWHNYEYWHIKRMGNRYGLEEELKTLLFPYMIDLHKIATKAYVFPTYRYGLKDIAQYLGFKWRHDDINALDAIAYYFKYQEDPNTYKNKLNTIVDYNEDDCIATKIVKDWLHKRSL